MSAWRQTRRIDPPLRAWVLGIGSPRRDSQSHRVEYSRYLVASFLILDFQVEPNARLSTVPNRRFLWPPPSSQVGASLPPFSSPLSFPPMKRPLASRLPKPPKPV